MCRYLNSQIMTGQISDYELRTFNLFAVIHGQPDLECANYMKDNLKSTLQNFLPKVITKNYIPCSSKYNITSYTVY